MTSDASIEPASVLTLVKGRGEHLRRLLAGLAEGTRRPAECIVVNMGSEALSLPEVNFPVRVHEFPRDGLPLAAARNAAAALARSPTLVFLDVDCIPAANLVQAMTADATGEALVCCEVLYLPAPAPGDRFDEASLLARGVTHEVRNFPRSGLRPEANAGLFWSLAFSIRKSAFERIGGFDESFHGYGGEDTDFSFRARDAGVKLVFTGHTRAFHQHHGIHDPPLNHFADIVANAGRFQARHGFWPMRGWLDAFAERRLIAPPGATGPLQVLRTPDAAEVTACVAPPGRAY